MLCALCVGVPELKSESGSALRPIPHALENQKTAVGLPALNLPGQNRLARSAAILVPISQTLENQKTAVGLPALQSPSLNRDITRFYFCEKCGKRVTDKQLEAGQGRDKKVRGIYCQECAAGVLTIEFESIKAAPEDAPSIAPPPAIHEPEPAEPPVPPAPVSTVSPVSPVSSVAEAAPPATPEIRATPAMPAVKSDAESGAAARPVSIPNDIVAGASARPRNGTMLRLALAIGAAAAIIAALAFALASRKNANANSQPDAVKKSSAE